MLPFVESEMTFGPYADGHCFRVEQTETYRAIQDGVKMAEFLLLRTQENDPPFIWIVEAKKAHLALKLSQTSMSSSLRFGTN